MLDTAFRLGYSEHDVKISLTVPGMNEKLELTKIGIFDRDADMRSHK